MNIIWLLVRESAPQVVLAVLAGLVSGGCSAKLIALINDAVKDPLQPGLAWQFVGLLAIALLTSPISQFLLVRLSQDAIYRLRLRLSQRIMAAPLAQLEGQGANRLLAVLTDDVTNLSNAVFAIPFLCIDGAIIIGCLVYLGLLSQPVLAAAVVMMLFGIVTVQLILNQAQHYLRQARNEQDQLFQHFRAITDGIKELKLNARRRQGFVDRQLSVSADASRRDSISALNLFALATVWGQMLFFAIVGGLVLGLPRLMAIDPLVLSGFVLTLTYLMRPFESLMQRLPVLLKANVSLQKIEELGLSLEAQAEDLAAGVLKPIQLFQSLRFEAISHHYGGGAEDFCLGPVDLSFKPGEIVFIVGGNGSGKSTLAKIITGLYSPEDGTVRLNGDRVTPANLEWYRQHFSTVFVDFYLFNQLLGHEATAADLDGRVRRYLKDLQIDHKVEIKDGQLSTTALSQGQRKRLALLTAYLDDRPIYLFDEWAADQDPTFRALFYEEILPGLRDRGKLILAISHDDRYFDLADRIIKLDYGKIESDWRPLKSAEETV